MRMDFGREQNTKYDILFGANIICVISGIEKKQ